MDNDKFKIGTKHGFSMALYAIRNVDKNIKYPETHGKLGEIPWQEQNIIYNAQKDILYKIYKEIKKEQESQLD